MKSLYAKYIEERTEDHIIEDDYGFATFRYLPQGQVYIIDIYVIPEFRRMGIAKDLANRICDLAKKNGYKELLGTVNPSCKGANESMEVLLAYRMKVFSASENLIIFKKDI